MSMLLQSGGGGFNTSLLQQSDDRVMPKNYQWDFAGSRSQIDKWANGMLWSSSRMGAGSGVLQSPPRFEADFQDILGGAQQAKLVGFTRDSTGAVLGGCLVKGYVTATDVLAGQVTSDGGGYFELCTPYAGVAHYEVAYLPGSPDVAGSTVNTLIPV